MLHTFALFLILLLQGAILLGCVYLCFGCWQVLRFLARAAPPPAPLQPPATLLKPLHGLDADLLENLRSFCRQDYPHYQIIFGVQHEHDPARQVAEQVQAEFPQLDITLIVDATQQATNMKVANLLNMIGAAKHDLLVISDSDMRVTPDYLARVTAPLQNPGTGLVTCLYRGVAAQGLWSRLASQYVNFCSFPQALIGTVLQKGEGCFGASIALRRATLEAIGGFIRVAEMLAEDHALGVAVRQTGRQVVVSDYLIENVMFEPSLKALFHHELRWARTIRFISPLGYAGTFLTHPLALALVAWGVAGVAGVPTQLCLALLLLAACLRGITALLQTLALEKHGRKYGESLWLLPLRDLLSFSVFLASFFSGRVTWRGRVFAVDSTGQLSDTQLLKPELTNAVLNQAQLNQAELSKS